MHTNVLFNHKRLFYQLKEQTLSLNFLENRISFHFTTLWFLEEAIPSSQIRNSFLKSVSRGTAVPSQQCLEAIYGATVHDFVFDVCLGPGGIRDWCRAGRDLLLHGFNRERLVHASGELVGHAPGFRSARRLQGVVEMGRRPAVARGAAKKRYVCSVDASVRRAQWVLKTIDNNITKRCAVARNKMLH